MHVHGYGCCLSSLIGLHHSYWSLIGTLCYFAFQGQRKSLRVIAMEKNYHIHCYKCEVRPAPAPTPDVCVCMQGWLGQILDGRVKGQGS